MSGKTGRIENDEQYERSLAWLVAEAERLDTEEDIHDPLLKQQEKANLMRRYNFVEAGILEYQKRQREDVNKQPESVQPPTPIVQQEPVPEAKPPEPESKARFAAFLDD